MKKLITSSLFVVCTLSASTTMPSGEMDLSWVDEHISAIAQKRVGISNSKINAVNNPMKITIVRKKTKKSGPVAVKGKKPKKAVVKADPLKLKAIMNSKALVGSKWYKVNDTILGYKVVAISGDKVHLSSKKKKKILFLNKTNKSIQIKSK